jgi:hypothetical protein
MNARLASSLWWQRLRRASAWLKETRAASGGPRLSRMRPHGATSPPARLIPAEKTVSTNTGVRVTVELAFTVTLV